MALLLLEDSKLSKFLPNGKPIALLFGENFSFLNAFYIQKIF